MTKQLTNGHNLDAILNLEVIHRQSIILFLVPTICGLVIVVHDNQDLKVLAGQQSTILLFLWSCHLVYYQALTKHKEF